MGCVEWDVWSVDVTTLSFLTVGFCEWLHEKTPQPQPHHRPKPNRLSLIILDWAVAHRLTVAG